MPAAKHAAKTLISERTLRFMNAIYEAIENVFTWLMKFGILAIELVGVAVLFVSVVRAVWELWHRGKYVRLHLAEGIALSLEFKMGGELLRTVIVREWSELLILGAVILLRAALTFLIQWEIRNEKKNGVSIETIQKIEAIEKTADDK